MTVKTKASSAFLQAVYGNDRPTAAKNRLHWMFTAPYFTALMRELHLNDVREQGYRETRYPAFLTLANRPENSFYVEAVKS